MIYVELIRKEIVWFRESLFAQIRRYAGEEGHVGDKRFSQKTTTSNHENDYHRIRSDHFGLLLSKIATKYPELKKRCAFVYSIPCSNETWLDTLRNRKSD